jgi:hypothetical protein
VKISTEYSNRTSAFLALIGVIAAGIAGFMPWLELSGPSVTVAFKMLSVPLPDSLVEGGLHDGGVVLLVVAFFGLLIAFSMFGSTRNRALIRRMLLLVIGGAFAAFGALMVTKPAFAFLAIAGDNDAARDADLLAGHGGNAVERFLHGAAALVIHVKVDAGAYVLLAGGVVVVLASLVPASKSQRFDEDAYY